jgi:hypothetical protein
MALAKQHLKNGPLILYDVSSSYMEGRCCPLAQRGYSRDGRRGTLQIIYDLATTNERPIFVAYTPTLRKSGKTACQSRLRRFCFIDDPAWLPGQ